MARKSPESPAPHPPAASTRWQRVKLHGYSLIKNLVPKSVQRLIINRNQKNRIKKFLPMVTSREFNETPKLIHLHIPKTAGASFSVFCQQKFPDATAINRQGIFDPAEWNPARVVGGHFQYACFEAAGPGHIFVSVLRDPVERALSLFRWYSQVEMHRDFRISLGFDPSSLQSTLRNSIMHMEFMHNPQCRFLANSTDFGRTLEVMNSRPFIVGTFEQLGDWVDALFNALGWEPEELPVTNRISEEKPSCDDEEALAMLRRYNQQDQLLYNYVREQGVFNSLPADFDREPFRP